MTENESMLSPLGLINKIKGWVTSVIAFIVAIAGFIKLWQGNTGLITTLLIILGISGLLIICAYIVFKKIPSPLDITTKRFAFPELRPTAITGLILIPLILIIGFGYRIYLKNKPTGKIIVLVADFVGPKPQKWAVTEKILERLENALAHEPKARLKALGKTITQQEGSSKAKEIGAEQKASIIIWGWYAVTEQACNISVHFDILKKQRLIPKIEFVPHLAQVSEIQNFVLQTRLSKELTCLTTFIFGLINYQTSAYHDAIRNFTKALAEKIETFQSIDEEEIYFYRGISYYFLKEFYQAITDYSIVIEINPKLALVFNNRGNAYADLNNYDRAIADYNKAIELDPKLATAFNSRGLVYAGLNDYDRAMADFNQAIALDPKYATAFINRGITYANLNDYDRAMADYNKAIELNPKLVQSFYNRGIAYADLNDYDRAITDYNKAIELDPKYVTAFYNRGCAYATLNDYDRAIADYNKAIELKPRDATAFNNRGDAYYDLGDFNRAVADYTKAIDLDPKDATAFFNRGLTYFYLNNYDRAIVDNMEAIELDPKYISAYENLTLFLILARKMAEAEQTARSAIELAESSEDQVISKYLLAVALKIQDKSTTAIDADLEQFCAKEFEIGWSFDGFENWLEQADISEQIKVYIREKRSW